MDVGGTHMIIRLNLKDVENARKVLDVQLNSYRVEARLISFDGIPPLKDSVESLIQCDEIFYGYFIDDVLAGIISYKVIENVLDIHRVAVHPQFFRRGIADRLIGFVEEVENDIEKIVVSTGKENIPAVSLYLKKGYIKTGDVEISKGIYITEFEKKVI